MGHGWWLVWSVWRNSSTWTSDVSCRTCPKCVRFLSWCVLINTSLFQVDNIQSKVINRWIIIMVLLCSAISSYMTFGRGHLVLHLRRYVRCCQRRNCRYGGREEWNTNTSINNFRLVFWIISSFMALNARRTFICIVGSLLSLLVKFVARIAWGTFSTNAWKRSDADFWRAFLGQYH